MKLGNISQTIVPVLKFFTDKNIRTVQIFKGNNYTKKKLERNKSYFRSSDILKTNCDLNLNNNPRTFNDGWQGSNTIKYIPIYDRGVFPSNAEKKKTYFPNIIDTFKVKKIEKPSNKNEFHNANKFLKQTNLNTFLKKDLRKEIIDNTKNLLDRINITYDMKKWNEFDCRTTMNTILQTAYSPLIDAIQNTNDYKQEFMKTLDEKSLNLSTISDKAKMSIIRNIRKKEKFNDNKNTTNIKNRTMYGLIRNKSDLDGLLNKNVTNLLNLKKNNDEPPKYSKEDQKFIDENANITKKINKCNLYKNFPSKTRMEFEVKKVFPIKKQFGFNDEWGKIDIKNYKSKKEIFSSLQPMWIRPLHIDAFKIRK